MACVPEARPPEALQLPLSLSQITLLPKPCMFLNIHQVNKPRLACWMMRNMEEEVGESERTQLPQLRPS